MNKLGFTRSVDTFPRRQALPQVVAEGCVVEWRSDAQVLEHHDRSVAVTYGTTGTQLVDDTSLDPNRPDTHEAVRTWIDLRPS